VVALLSCKKLEDGAKEQFARQYSCPENRISVEPRPELKWSELVFGKQAPEQPPDEVKRDPERLAKWKSDHQNTKSSEPYQMFRVTGCDHEAYFGCTHPTDPHGGGTQVGLVNCSEAPAPGTKK
jgi:hypothetical protein